nr:MAG TPA: hypothetical protein [Caudoviricetes sp.]
MRIRSGGSHKTTVSQLAKRVLCPLSFGALFFRAKVTGFRLPQRFSKQIL